MGQEEFGGRHAVAKQHALINPIQDARGTADTEPLTVKAQYFTPVSFLGTFE